MGLSWGGTRPAARGTQPQGLSLPSGLSDGVPGCCRGWEGWTQGLLPQGTSVQGLGVQLPTGTRRRDERAGRALRWRPGAQNQAGCGKPDPPPRPGRELLQRLGGSRREGAVPLPRGSRPGPFPARQRGQCRSAVPGTGHRARPGVLPQPRSPEMFIPRCPVVTSRYSKALPRMFPRPPAGGPAWRRWQNQNLPYGGWRRAGGNALPRAGETSL